MCGWMQLVSSLGGFHRRIMSVSESQKETRAPQWALVVLQAGSHLKYPNI